MKTGLFRLTKPKVRTIKTIVKTVTVTGLDAMNDLRETTAVRQSVPRGTPDIPALRAEVKEKQKKFRRP